MSTNEGITEKFDLFLVGKLDKAEAEALQQELIVNPDIQQAFDEHKLVVDGIRSAARKELIAKVKEWDTQISFENKVEIRSIKIGWYYAAAALVILLSLSTLLLFLSQGTNESQLVASYYAPYSFLSDVTRGGEAHNAGYIDLYQQGLYKEVIDQISVLDFSAIDAQQHFILGNALQATGDYTAAMTEYQVVIDSGSIYSSAAKWYTALCYLSLGQRDKASVYLDLLADPKSSYSQKALELGEKLK